eukprot:c7695_g1_i1.p3 GENE.c7695_g1_i1~~c7695_g1_i1.p3  ORF type:complete len:118 (+),score=33.58 c7695_g1_i1:45-398(+)
MSAVASNHDELCVAYATLLLADSEVEVTAANINAVVKASGNTVEAYWPTLFARHVGSLDVNALITSVSSAAPAAAAPAAGGAAAAAAPAADAGKGGKKKEPEPEPEEDGDMGFGLFD